jgi:hypothetical protein
MITFQEFLYKSNLILEKYYEPNEKLPSGKTPVEKAEARQERPAKTLRARGRKIRHKYRLERSVRRGANNPNIDTSGHPDLSIRSNSRTSSDYDFHHHPSGIKYHVRELPTKDKQGRSTYSIAWTHSHKGAAMSDKTARHTARNALRVWDNHIVHRLPHNTVVVNSPSPTYKFDKKTDDYIETNPRARLYQRKGFGRLKAGEQFAEVGRTPSPKQRAKGKNRLKPLD